VLLLQNEQSHNLHTGNAGRRSCQLPPPTVFTPASFVMKLCHLAGGPRKPASERKPTDPAAQMLTPPQHTRHDWLPACRRPCTSPPRQMGPCLPANSGNRNTAPQSPIHTSMSALSVPANNNTSTTLTYCFFFISHLVFRSQSKLGWISQSEPLAFVVHKCQGFALTTFFSLVNYLQKYKNPTFTF